MRKKERKIERESGEKKERMREGEMLYYVRHAQCYHKLRSIMQRSTRFHARLLEWVCAEIVLVLTCIFIVFRFIIRSFKMFCIKFALFPLKLIFIVGIEDTITMNEKEITLFIIYRLLRAFIETN